MTRDGIAVAPAGLNYYIDLFSGDCADLPPANFHEPFGFHPRVGDRSLTIAALLVISRPPRTSSALPPLCPQPHRP